MTTELPIFKDWVVDLRLKEFRRVRKHRLELLEFNSYKGDLLLGEYIRGLPRKKAIIIGKLALE